MRVKLGYNIVRTLRVSVMILLVLVYSTISNISVYGSTVNDLRNILGNRKIKEGGLKDGIGDINRNDVMTELNNIAAEMDSYKSKIIKKSDSDVNRLVLMDKINKQAEVVYKRFVNNESVSSVLQAKAILDNYVYEASKIEYTEQEISIEPIYTTWAEDYQRAQEVVDEYADDFDIGYIGNEMKHPVEWSFSILDIFGTQRGLDVHTGIDFEATLATNVLSQWNGVVSNIYKSEKYRIVVEIGHGHGLKTKYAYLDKVFVNIGDEVNQYQTIGILGQTDGLTPPHLHFEVHLDNNIIDPVQIFEDNGVGAILDFATRNPEVSIEHYGISDKEYSGSKNVMGLDLVNGSIVDSSENSTESG